MIQANRRVSGSLQPESEADCAGLSDYLHARSGLISHHEYLIPALLRELGTLDHAPDRARVFDLGCGNGVVASILASRGYAVTGVDPSSSGIRLCRSRFPGLDLHRGSAYDDLRSKYGQFPIVTSLEVVEHVFAPRKYAATLYELLEPEGTAIVSTPFHGYWKNVALAVSGRMDDHYLPLWD